MGGAANRLFWLLLQGLILCMSPVSASSCSASTFSELQTCLSGEETSIEVTADITITSVLTISKTGTSLSSTLGEKFTLDGGGSVRLFNIDSGITVSFTSLILTNGYASDGTGGVAIRGTDVSLILKRVTLSACTSLTQSALGGAVYLAGGYLNTTDCKFLNNYLYTGDVDTSGGSCSVYSSYYYDYSSYGGSLYLANAHWKSENDMFVWEGSASYTSSGSVAFEFSCIGSAVYGRFFS